MFGFDLVVIGKYISVVFIFILITIYQLVILFSLIKKRKTIDFLAPIKHDGKLSKSGIFFVITMVVIIYQSIFLNTITDGLIQLMMVIIASECGATWLSNSHEIKLEKVKKIKNQALSDDEINNL